jgi:hypothetical protein
VEVILDEEICHKLGVIELVDCEDGIDVVSLLHFDEREGRKSMYDEWNIRSETGSTLVYVYECLKIRDEHKNEKTLFQRIFNGAKFFEKELKF